jgi:phospholipase C
LTSVFRPFHGEKISLPLPLKRDAFLTEINRAQYRPVPKNFRRRGPDELREPERYGDFPRQEPGVRPSCALPYELSVDGGLGGDREAVRIRFRAGNRRFGARSAGAPFHVYSSAKMRTAGGGPPAFEAGRTWDYAVAAGSEVEDTWHLADFEGGAYALRVHGPNGFFREFRGSAEDPPVLVSLLPAAVGPAAREADLALANTDAQKEIAVLVEDLSYGGGRWPVTLGPATGAACRANLRLPLSGSLGWYDLSVSVAGHGRFAQRFAGRIEDGKVGFSDPQMGSAALRGAATT